MKTVSELLNTLEFMNNQTRLANELNVNRGTLIKYMKDFGGEFHTIRTVNGSRQLMVLTSRAKRA